MQHLILSVAKPEFLVKPVGALYALHAGVAKDHHDFWAGFSVQNLFHLYMSLNATPAAVIGRIEEPEELNSNQLRAFGYLTCFIGNMTQDKLRCFL